MKIQNSKTKTYLVIGLSLVAMLVSSSSLSSVFAQATDNDTAFSAQEDAIPSDIIQEVSKVPYSKDANFLNIEEKVHGFSGAYVDKNGNLNIYTTDPTIKSVDKSVLTDYIQPYDLTKEIIVKHSNHSWHKWVELDNIAIQLFENRTLGVSTMGVDDKNQVFQIGFESLDQSKIDVVNAFLANHKIPSDMVELVQTGTTIPVSSGLTINPIEGAAEIQVVGWTSSPPVCTTGFIVKDAGGNYRGLTAGHCMTGTNWNNGNQQYKQPNNGRLIGNQIAGKFGSTNSDSLLFTTSETGGFGEIYEYGHGTVTITGTATGGQLVGDTVCFSGTATDNTVCNSVIHTGLQKFDSGVGTTLNGQNEAGFFAISGDSGSPVWNPNGGITAYGTVWGVDSTGTYYSPISGINTDLGTLTFH